MNCELVALEMYASNFDRCFVFLLCELLQQNFFRRIFFLKLIEVFYLMFFFGMIRVFYSHKIDRKDLLKRPSYRV